MVSKSYCSRYTFSTPGKAGSQIITFTKEMQHYIHIYVWEISETKNHSTAMANTVCLRAVVNVTLCVIHIKTMTYSTHTHPCLCLVMMKKETIKVSGVNCRDWRVIHLSWGFGNVLCDWQNSAVNL